MSNIDKQLDLLEFVFQSLNLKRHKKRAIHDDPSSSNGTLPLSNKTLASKNNSPCVGAAYLGGTALSTYVGAPQVLRPSAFSYIVLGPLILSPYILSPNILTPVVLSPSILNPTLLSPNILSPTLLSP
uniref:Uncharacterized protein n=1 Tax=Romanomermis culicivorax TaxID=13658 RepID=A0A915L6F4_ROMCU